MAPSDGTRLEATGQRLDQWLWHARIAKSRTLAQALIGRGKVRINTIKTDKPSHWLKPGDVVTLSLGPRVRVVEVRDIGARRGPASEAQLLFQELTPVSDQSKSSQQSGAKDGPSPVQDSVAAVRPIGAGRPTKRERRATERLKDRFREC